jgi:hypothetical protein
MTKTVTMMEKETGEGVVESEGEGMKLTMRA